MTTWPKFVFVAEWQEPYAPAPRKFILTFHSQDNTVEMFDVNSRRLFLRRTPCDTVDISNLYVGSKINVLSRFLTLTDYGDAATKQLLGPQMERALAMVRVDDLTKLGDVLDAFYKNDLEIMNMKTFLLTPKQELAIQRKLSKPGPFSTFILSGKLLAIELKGVGSAQKWNEIRSDLNITEVSYGTMEKETSEFEINLIFSNDSIQCNTATFQDSTCCIVKPHILREGNLVKVLDRISYENLNVTAMEMVHLDMDRAEEFFEVYRGIIPNHQKMLEEMTSGPVLAMEISGTDAQKKLREIVGPHDLELAKLLKPDTIRARFGKDGIRNAVHCTDLPEDARLEVEYFFQK